MLKYILAAAMLASAPAAGALVLLAFTWSQLGYGLHPAVSLPLAGLTLTVGFLAASYIDDLEFEDTLDPTLR